MCGGHNNAGKETFWLGRNGNEDAIRAALALYPAPMSASILKRPLWRRFRPAFLSRAADHVKAGGHAAVIADDGRVRVLLPVDEKGLPVFALWSLLAIEHRRYRRVKDGPAVGLAAVLIRREFVSVVLDWCTRDSMFPGSTRKLKLDCTTCAACCHDANVVLEEKDLERFRAEGRQDLTERAYIKRAKDGIVTLRFAKDGRCQLLAEDKLCSIYSIRPYNCRAFVAGSEACLAAREDTLGVRDGAPKGESALLIEMGKKHE